ncbi:MAG: hypothetical protein Q8P15_00225 [Nanoarchaeota archaeon]|nr:hypothetical protein [Nanoarchaeota archaeon]
MNEKEFIKKISEFNKEEKLDLSSGEDLSIALMNLVSLEEHSFFSYAKTEDEKFLDVLEKTREIRKKYLKLIVKENDAEIWCMSKHLLATSMRLYEVGTKFLHEGKKKEAKEMYKDAFEIYALFWRINLQEIKTEVKEKGKFSDKLKKLLDCCRE